MSDERITERQRNLPRIDWREQVAPTQRRSFLRHMCWWRLEAMRASSSPETRARNLQYARAMRWAAEHAAIKPGTWSQIVERAGARP